MASVLPNVLKLKPPLVIEEAEVATVLGVLADCLKQVFPGRPPDNVEHDAAAHSDAGPTHGRAGYPTVSRLRWRR